MPSTSRIGAAEDALLAVLQSVITPVPVSLGHPLEQLQSRHVWIDPSFTAPQEWDTTVTGAGGGNKAETITIPVVVWYRDSSLVASRDGALNLVALLEGALRTDSHLGMPTDVWDAGITSIEKDAIVTTEGWTTVLQVMVTVHARLGG